ncbi:hypothetical protein BVG19_g5055 [[Candida] boidinii]|nr:hypothetical protein BVG19_g5055 [[Candida] boidinii]OWB52561.1 hypothetical protein B5S27_g4138 [[Candida] boidinii]OWB85621.1 hypothetical protein B5S33_g4290 [[Candida] boidinii]
MSFKLLNRNTTSLFKKVSPVLSKANSFRFSSFITSQSLNSSHYNKNKNISTSYTFIRNFTMSQVVKSDELPSEIIDSNNSGDFPIQTSIIKKVEKEYKPVHFEIYNDSYKHAHHAGLRGASNTTESHFRMVIISDAFKGMTLPARHRTVYKLLDDEIKLSGVHAIQLKTKTVEEWDKEQQRIKASQKFD